MDSHRLQASIEGDELVIRIGIARLSQSAEQCPKMHEHPEEYGPPYCSVFDAKELARDVHAA